ncbi:MAG: linear amide C-N hydrolase [Calditrichaeota bacterium]|nr:linear amide C-N hydrolase [Calditrichota bacterium]
MKKILILILISFVTIDLADACTTFVMRDSTNLIFGRNYDFDLGSGFIVINKRGVEKRAIAVSACEPAKWISEYGSITFNQVGIDAPMGGMNEKGLVIAQMALPESEYPRQDDKPILNQFEWIQYQLDKSASLAEVIENSKKIQIVPVAIPVHYLICDSAGNMGVAEFLNGRFVVYRGKDATISVCSNMSYGQSKKAAEDYEGFGGQKPVPEKWENIPDIIAIAASKIDRFKKMKIENPVDYGFEILSAVGSPTRTQWSVVYDIENRRIHFKTLGNKTIRTIGLENLDYSCDSGVSVFNLQNKSAETDITGQFVNLTKENYFDYKKNLMNWFKANVPGFPDIPDKAIEAEAEYAFNRRCK